MPVDCKNPIFVSQWRDRAPEYPDKEQLIFGKSRRFVVRCHMVRQEICVNLQKVFEYVAMAYGNIFKI